MATKTNAPEPTIIDNVEALQARMKEMRKAQEIFATYTQEQVDKIFFAAAMPFIYEQIILYIKPLKFVNTWKRGFAVKYCFFI